MIGTWGGTAMLGWLGNAGCELGFSMFHICDRLLWNPSLGVCLALHT